MQEQIEKEKEEVIYTNPEDAIKAMLAKLKRLKFKRASEIMHLEVKKQDIEDEIRSLTEKIDREIAEIENDIKNITVSDVKRSIKTEYGAAIYRRGSVRASYDKDALDAIQDEKVKEIIKPFRKETETDASVKVEVY